MTGSAAEKGRAPGRPPGLPALLAVAFGAGVLWLTRSTVPAGPLALQLAPALVAGAFLLGALGLGAPVVRLLPGLRDPDGPGWWVLAAAAGTALLAAWAALLASVGLLGRAPLALSAGAAAAAGLRVLWRRTPFTGRLGTVPPAPSVLLGAAAAATYPVLAAFLPAYDTLNYHLGMPFQWLRAGTLVVFPRDVYSVQPANTGLVFTFALALAGPWAAQAVHWALGGLTLAGTAALARGPGEPEEAAWWAAALLAVTPALLMVSTLAYSDLGVAAFAAAAWLLALRALAVPRGRRTLLLAAGAAAGAALGCKYTAGPTVVVPLLAGVAAAGGARSPGKTLRDLLATGTGVLAAFAPWALRNLVVTGNPVHPYLAGFWAGLVPGSGAGEGGGGIARGLGTFPGPLPPLERILSLGALGVRPHGGLVGALFLALLPVTAWLVARSWRRSPGNRTLAVGAAVGYAGWLLAPPLGRYLLGTLVPLAALAGRALAAVLRGSSRGVAAAVSAALLFGGLWYAAGSLDRVWPRRIAVALGQESPAALLRSYASHWPAVEAAARLPESARILLVAEARPMFWERDVVVEDPFRTPLLVELARDSASPREMADALRGRGVTHVFFNGIEARRIARMVGRKRYFQPETAGAGRRLERFFREELTPVWSEGELALWALRPGEPQSGS